MSRPRTLPEAMVFLPGHRDTFIDALAELADIDEQAALDALRKTLDEIGWRVFGEEHRANGGEIVDACIEALDAKREELRLAEETLQLLVRFQLIQDGAIHSQHVDTEARRLLAMWDEPHRKYHTRAHLIACLDELDKVKHKAADWKCISLALWCHDAVYRTERKGVPLAGVPLLDNESRSAMLCGDVGQRLGWERPRFYSASMMVQASGHTRGRIPKNYDEALMLDIDLAILSAPPADYDRFELQIREEYAHVPDDVFRSGRAAILRALGGEAFSYRTGDFIGRNDAARANLTRAIARLETQP